MEIADIQQLNGDLRSSVQVDIYAKKQPGFFRQAPRSRGYAVFVNPTSMTLVVGKDDVHQEDWIRPLAEVGQIHIWTNAQGPNIYWERGDDDQFRRT